MPWGSIFGAAIGGLTSLIGAKKQNQQAQEASREQMDFQERMRSTQYQTSMADMRLAGLNPMLAYQQGGAGNLGGSTYSPVNIGAAGTTGASGGAATARQISMFKLDASLKRGERNLQHELTNKASDESGLAYQKRLNAMKEGDMLNSAVALQKIDEAFWKSEIGKRIRQAELVSRGVTPYIPFLGGRRPRTGPRRLKSHQRKGR